MGVFPHLTYGLFYYICGLSNLDESIMRGNSQREGAIKKRTILVVTDCMHGAMAACRFAARNLFDSDTTLLLLQTYRTSRYDQSTLRDISRIIEKTVKSELSGLSQELGKEFSISQDRIREMAVEGDLKEILQELFAAEKTLAIVMGFDPNLSKNTLPCRRLIGAVIESGLRPLFVVSDTITVIDQKNATLLAGERDNIHRVYQEFLEDEIGRAHV